MVGLQVDADHRFAPFARSARLSPIGFQAGPSPPFADPGRVDALMAEVDERFGFDRLSCLHVNDAAVDLGSQRDRHAEVGKGVIGRELAVMLGHPALQEIPAIMETPGGDEEQPYARSIRALRRFHRAGVKRAAERTGA